jgi:hypothetical protein
MTDSGLSVIAGLAIGIAFVLLFSMAWRLDNTLSDDEIIAKYSQLTEIRYFLEKYPDAQAEVERIPSGQTTIVHFRAERQVESGSEMYSGVNVLSVSAYIDKLNGLTLGIDCGVSQGPTIGVGMFHIGVGIADTSAIDQWEERCFRTSGNDVNVEIFAPDTSTDELNDNVYQFAFTP